VSKTRQPQKLGLIMESFLQQRGYLSVFRENQIPQRWAEIVGDKMAAESSCEGVENGILYVRVPSSAWRQEIAFLKARILSEIRSRTGCTSIKDIVFS
jgi:predicted nucleic acid-binding Zn ribbon protein